MAEQLYLFVIHKYNVEQPSNFKLDYLQNYFTNKIGLDANMKCIFSADTETFESDTRIVKISPYPRRYIDYYQPKFTIEITDKSDLSNTKTIGYKDFDSDRNLDQFITIMLEYIGETIRTVENFTQ